MMPPVPVKARDMKPSTDMVSVSTSAPRQPPAPPLGLTGNAGKLRATVLKPTLYFTMLVATLWLYTCV